LAQLERVAAASSTATVAALRALPRVYEEARRRWCASGSTPACVARDNPDAGMAFFALESRTSPEGAARQLDRRDAGGGAGCCASTCRC
jgi:hypothetical protein